MSIAIRKSFDDQLLDGLEEWRAQHPDQELWDNNVVAQWLINEKKFGLGRRLLRKEMTKRLAKAQNKKHVRNAQGKRVRVYHAAKFDMPGRDGAMVQKTLWAERLTMSASFAHSSFKLRHEHLEGAARSMFNDAADVNTNNPNLKDNPVQLELDLRYVSSVKKKEQRVETIPVDTEIKIVVGKAPSMSAARKIAEKRT